MVGAVAGVTAVTVLVITHHRIARLAGNEDLGATYESLRLLGTALIGAPAIIGAFWGAPLLGHELEAGTHRLVWTQSITRQRWLTIKLGIIALDAVVLIGSFSLTFTWWSAPFDQLGNRIGTANFGQRGVVPIAYALFALSLGTFAGAVLRRTLPAMGASLLGFGVVRYAIQLIVRPGLVNPIRATLPVNPFGQRGEQVPGMGNWILSSRTIDASGHTFSGGQIDELLVKACHLTRESSRAGWTGCVKRLGLKDVARFHPDSHFWALQLRESAIFLAFAALLVSGSLWWIHRSA